MTWLNKSWLVDIDCLLGGESVSGFGRQGNKDFCFEGSNSYTCSYKWPQRLWTYARVGRLISAKASPCLTRLHSSRYRPPLISIVICKRTQLQLLE